MHPRFAQLTDGLHLSFERLMACKPHSGPHRLSLNVPKCAVYLFSEGDEHLYVGRTDNLRRRHREHWAGKRNDAPFAFRLARDASNNISAKGGLKRSELALDPGFLSEFKVAKERIAAMQFRWVEESNANQQFLLEFYVAVALEARYNDFGNH